MKNILHNLLLLMSVLMFSVGFFAPPHAYADSQSWQDLPFNQSHAFATYTFPADSVVTAIHVGLSNVALDNVFDVCIYASNNSEPKYPSVIAGYSEIYCWNIQYNDAPGNWQTTLDLSDTPLYFPADSTFACISSGPKNTNATLNCQITFDSYQSNTPRYRSLRFPYTDMLVTDNLDIAPSYYVASPMFPLRVKKMGVFQSFGGEKIHATATPCLRWIHQGGDIVKEACFDTLVVNGASNYQSPEPMSIDWQIQSPDILTAVCPNSKPVSDCGLWAIVEIPNTITAESAELIFRDFQHVPAPFLANYCQAYVEDYVHPYFCGTDQSCSNQTKINQCIHLFPQANCVADNACAQAFMDGDVNHDDHVDIFDYNLVVANFGKTGENIADINLDSTVNIFDYNILIGNYGK